ncbi:MAG: glycerol-3-phosphate acyltransferase [Chloroflexota bacterium]
MSVGEAAVIAAAYVLGAVPTAYLVVRWLRGVDIRQYGSGNVGGSNVAALLGKPMGVAVAISDIFIKGSVPVLAADLIFGYGLGVQAAAGMAAVVGHNWSVLLGFHGGRGIGTGGGAIIAMSIPMAAGYAGVAFVMWAFFRSSPVAWLVSLATLPFWTAALDPEPPLVAFSVLFLVVTAGKRLIAATPPGYRSPPGAGRWELLLNRLLYDRDIKDRDAWVKRLPEA